MRNKGRSNFRSRFYSVRKNTLIFERSEIFGSQFLVNSIVDIFQAGTLHFSTNKTCTSNFYKKKKWVQFTREDRRATGKISVVEASRIVGKYLFYLVNEKFVSCVEFSFIP